MNLQADGYMRIHGPWGAMIGFANNIGEHWIDFTPISISDGSNDRPQIISKAHLWFLVELTEDEARAEAKQAGERMRAAMNGAGQQRQDFANMLAQIPAKGRPS